MAATVFGVFTAVLIIGQVVTGQIDTNIIDAEKLGQYFKALHTIVQVNCGSPLDQPEFDDFKAFLEQHIANAMPVNFSMWQPYHNLYTNLTGCAEFFTNPQNESAILEQMEISSTSKPAQAKPTDDPKQVEFNLVGPLLQQPTIEALDLIRKLVREIDHKIQETLRIKRDVYIESDTSKVLKAMTLVAVNECSKFNYPVDSRYLTLVGMLMTVQVDIGNNRDKPLGKLKYQIAKCAMQHKFFPTYFEENLKP